MANKKLGRPFADVKKIKKQVYLNPREVDRLRYLADREGLSESALAEKILVSALARRMRSV